ncbi:MAG: cyclic nucleotide-binding domain-containing protein [Kiritimatiellia bacterium]
MIKIMLLKKTFANGEALFKDGEPGGEACLIKKGYVSIWKMDGDRRIDLATRGPGEIIGEMALIDDSPRSASVTAKGQVEAEVITRQDLKKMLNASPEPLIEILHQLLKRLRETNELAAMNMSC